MTLWLELTIAFAAGALVEGAFGGLGILVALPLVIGVAIGRDCMR